MKYCAACGKEILDGYPYYKQVDSQNIVCEICYPEFRFKLFLERMSDMKEELKPCLHCGCSASFTEEERINEAGVKEIWHMIHCDNLFCYAQMVCFGGVNQNEAGIGKEDLIKMWNKSVGDVIE